MEFQLAEFMSSGSWLMLYSSFLKHLMMIQYFNNCYLVYIQSSAEDF